MTNNKNYTIAEYFTLPSEGKVYDELVNPKIKIRSMTTQEEMQRLSHNDKVYQNLCDIIDSCIVEGPNISSYDMCLGDYQFLLYKLRTVTYGADYQGKSTCPICGSVNEGNFSLDNLIVNTYSEELEKYREFELPVTKSIVRIRMRTPRMLDITQEKLREFKAKQATSDSTIMYTIQSIIESIDGAAPNPVYFNEWVKTLPMKDTNTIINYSDKLDSMIGIDTQIFYACDLCGSTFASNLKTDMEFFRPALRF